MSNLLWVLLSWLAVSWGVPQPPALLPEDGPGEPLFLTPYLEVGDIGEARRQARVRLNMRIPPESYSGFFTVNKAYNSNQFFWYFPTQNEKETAPVVIWLQGGPGASSLFGLFLENGPLAVINGEIRRKEGYHWALNHHLIFIDNPVGAGFSFTNHTDGYCTNETQVGEQLYSTLTQFFRLFPELQQRDFFITGESYGGKFVPALAYTIHKKNPTADIKINLKGLIIGGAWINPESQIHYSLSGAHNYLNMNTQDKTCKPDCQPDWMHDEFADVLRTNPVRRTLHVGPLDYDELNCVTYNHLKVDFCESMAPWLSELLDHYPVTLYGGQNDTTVPYAGIVDFLKNHFNFTAADEYRKAKQYSWRLHSWLCGCVRSAGLLTEIYVPNATHFVPKDQPLYAWDMLTRITHGERFDQKEICPVTPPST